MKPPSRRAGLLFLLAVVSLLPHLSALVSGRSYYFRDFGMAFFPYREFWSRELLAGRMPFWNPLIQEGAFAFPMVYPPDLIQLLWRGPVGLSVVLTLHFPLAAIGAYLLARELRAGRLGAFLCGAVYALGGLAVASLNLYVFLQALALAPLVVWLLFRAATRGGRWIPAAALGVAIALTTAQEFIAQALLLGLALGLTSTRSSLTLPRRAAALALAIAIGAALAAVPSTLIASILPETPRGRGLPTSMMLDYSLHPAVLLQLFIRDLFGSVSSPLELWWGRRFFTKGFPYFTTFYLGPHVLAVACCGIGALAPRRRWLLLGLALLALWYALGVWGGLAPAVTSWPIFKSIRFPSKAFLLPYLVIAILVGRGAGRLARGGGWRTYARAIGALALLSAGLAAFAWSQPVALGEWMGSDQQKDALVSRFLVRECLGVALLAALGVGAAVAVIRGRLLPLRAAALIGVVIVLDLVRAATGANPQIDPRFFKLLPETAAAGLDRLDGGRVFSLGTEASPVFRQFLARRLPTTLWIASFVKRQMLAPYTNLLDGVESVPADDIGAFVLAPPEISIAEHSPQQIGRLLPRLRGASVSRILSLDPLDHPELARLTSVPTGVPELNIHIYELKNTWPRAYVACRAHVVEGRAAAWSRAFAEGFDPARDVALETPGTASCGSGRVRRTETWAGHDAYEVELDGPGFLVTRDSFARGWHARRGETALPVVRANGKHRAVPLPAGQHQVVFDYRPPGLVKGLWWTAAGLAAATAMALFPILVGRRRVAPLRPAETPSPA